MNKEFIDPTPGQNVSEVQIKRAELLAAVQKLTEALRRGNLALEDDEFLRIDIEEKKKELSELEKKASSLGGGAFGAD